MSKKIILTETQERKLVNYIIKEMTYTIEPNKVLLVKKYLDKNFQKGKLDKFGDNGMPTSMPVVGMLVNNEVVKNLTARQLLDVLEDEFRGMFNDKDKLKKFLTQVLKDWYYNRISKEGLLSKTNC